MTEKTLREAVARAICNALGDDWEREGPDGLAAYYEPADAVIATIFERLRTPSEGMIEAGGERFGDVFSDMPLDCEDDRQGALKIWQAMLTAFQQENSDE